MEDKMVPLASLKRSAKSSAPRSRWPPSQKSANLYSNHPAHNFHSSLLDDHRVFVEVALTHESTSPALPGLANGSFLTCDLSHPSLWHTYPTSRIGCEDHKPSPNSPLHDCNLSIPTPGRYFLVDTIQAAFNPPGSRLHKGMASRT
ncbi:hypothetical protein NM688_g1707 [Phlebia brevispora]|uniref:Uncharacterized protein n=1 Tax=Phlebia brevispora TaxID=194682 RepID=A0ACC1TAB9_9APHY|nr:hypothetical protein NM688_g1707 [Phlebia brevispora]